MPRPWLAQFLGRVARQLHAAFLAGEHQLRAKGAHGLAALYALVFRHHQYHLVAAHRRRHRQRNAGVAAGRFDQGIARLDLAARLGLCDHRQRGPVFHRARRIIAFQLGQYGVGGRTGDALQLDQRRVADKIFEGMVHGLASL